MSIKIGKEYEQKAKEFLHKNNFSIVDTNFYAKKFGEIDIIAKKNNIYHFVEVKAGAKFDAIYNVTPSKINKLIRSISYYVSSKNITNAYQLDVIVFRNNDIEFLQNITL